MKTNRARLAAAAGLFLLVQSGTLYAANNPSNDERLRARCNCATGFTRLVLHRNLG